MSGRNNKKANSKTRSTKKRKTQHKVKQPISIQRYVETGKLKKLISQSKFPLMPYIFFVSYEEKILRLLIGGECPNCKANHVRNCCNIRYCEEVILPVLKRQYSEIIDVVPVFTTERDFESLIHSNGGIYYCSYIIEPPMKANFYESYSFILDKHPNIGSVGKTLILKDPNDTPFALERKVTLQQIYEKYKICWYVMDSTHVVNPLTGKLITGIEPILKEIKKMHICIT